MFLSDAISHTVHTCTWHVSAPTKNRLHSIHKARNQAWSLTENLFRRNMILYRPSNDFGFTYWCLVTQICASEPPVVQLMVVACSALSIISSLPKQNGRHFTDDAFKRIFFNEIFFIKISLKFVPGGPVNKISALVQLIAWRRSSHYLNQCWLDYRRIYHPR